MKEEGGRPQKELEHNLLIAGGVGFAPGFCADCVTHLFFKFKKIGDYNKLVEIFQGLNGLEMDMQCFSDQRPDYYCFSNQPKETTKAEIVAYFAESV